MSQSDYTCMICGKPLENTNSIEAGVGPVCAARLGIFAKHPKSDKDPFDSDYGFHVIDIDGRRVGIVIDNDNGRSVTNAIEKVAADMGVEHIVYRDSMGVWDYWSEATGFKTCSADRKNGNRDMDSAIEIARARYISIGGLFA